MASRIRRWIESIVFMGMNPDQPNRAASQADPSRWLGPLRGPVERFLSGGRAPKDPLYLSNRTLGQKLRHAALIVTPCAIVAVFVGLAAADFSKKRAPVQPPDLTPAERAAKILPKLDLVKGAEREIDVTEVSVDRSSGMAVIGTVKNKTSHSIREAEIVFDLSDESGSQLGGVRERLTNLAPNSTQKFRIPIVQQSAMLALVREVHIQ